MARSIVVWSALAIAGASVLAARGSDAQESRRDRNTVWVVGEDVSARGTWRAGDVLNVKIPVAMSSRYRWKLDERSRGAKQLRSFRDTDVRPPSTDEERRAIQDESTGRLGGIDSIQTIQVKLSPVRSSGRSDGAGSVRLSFVNYNAYSDRKEQGQYSRSLTLRVRD